MLIIKKLTDMRGFVFSQIFLDNFISSFYSHVFQHLSDDKNVSSVLSWLCQQDCILGYQKKTRKNIKKKKKEYLNSKQNYHIQRYKYNFIQLNLHSKALTEAKDFLCFFPLIRQWFEIRRVIRLWPKKIITIAK